MKMTRGSEWRRWELHLHTPYTQKEDRYSGNNAEEKWNNFYSSLQDYVGDGTDPLRSICAIAITDYLSIENYFKVCKDHRLPDCVKFVFPNVELRMLPIAKTAPINIHCLFAPDIAEELNDRFFAKLNVGGFGATRSELIRFGRHHLGDPKCSEEKAYHTGLEQYTISYDTLFGIFKNDPQLREKTIIVVSNKSNDGVSGARAHSDYFDGNTSQLDSVSRTIYWFADMIFSSNPKDISYFLGEGKKDSPDVIKKNFGSLMPCIHGSDAHCNDRIFAPDNDRFCWIKADPTFEGLKQVLYEPKERVRISSTIPDSKPSYYVIDYVEIGGNENFSSEPIYFSDKLTCIIGGKSTGKSLLLHNMARAIDKTQVIEKQQTAATTVRPLPELKVFWSDGVCSTDKDKQRKIVYIPQTYLNRLSDEKQETTEIDTIIQEIVLQDEKCHESYEQLQQNIAITKQDLAKAIVDFIKTVSDRTACIAERNAIGDHDAIEEEIKKFSLQLEQLTEKYDVTEKEVTSYQSAIEKIQELDNTNLSISKEKNLISSIDSVVEIKAIPNLTKLNKAVQDGIYLAKKAADSVWASQRTQIITDADKQLQDIYADKNEQLEIIARLKPKMEGNEQINKISISLVEEKEKLNRLKEVEQRLSTLETDYNQELGNLSKSFEKYSALYSTYVDFINEHFVSSTLDLEFSVNKVFRAELFSQKISQIINNRTYGRFAPINFNDTISEDVLISANISALIESLLTNSNTSLQLKVGYNIESALREILSDWYNVDYVVKMDGDSIQDMSPGKKALVLLRLLISLAESKCPILIDQPEDDLDNRSIFDELIHFIKERKIDRQIITVTHNANIVLGGDAELVIIANQSGKNAPNEHYRFEYRSGAIEDNTPVFDNDDGKTIVPGILNSKGIQEHICEILEGGEQAFALRQHKYRFIKSTII